MYYVRHTNVNAHIQKFVFVFRMAHFEYLYSGVKTKRKTNIHVKYNLDLQLIYKANIVSKLVLRLTDLPLIHSVARELEAMADPQPKVLNLASTIFPLSSTFICNIEFEIVNIIQTYK